MFKKFATTLAVAAFAAGTAFAAPPTGNLAPGQTITATTLSTTTANLTQQAPNINGTISPGTFTAAYGAGVFADSANPFCSGCLDFSYQVTNLGPGVVERVTGFDFTGFLTNAGFLTSTGGIAPATIDRSANGAVVGFNFLASGQLSAGDTTDYLIVQTNAMNFTQGLISIQDGSAGTATAYQPSAVTPEPSSLILLGTGLLGAAGAARRKFAL